MGSTHGRRRAGAASATVGAGALVFLTVGAAPASAQAPEAAGTAADCKLGSLLCGLLGGGGTAPSTPPPSGGGSAQPKPTAAPKPSAKPRPRAKPAPARPPRPRSGGAGRAADRPLGGADAPRIPVPQTRPTPALPDLTAQDPVVFPQPPSDGKRPGTTRLVAARDQGGAPIPPLLVATASGLIGAVAALNISVLNRRIRRPRSR